MEIRPLRLPGTYEILLAPHSDDRGYFMRVYDEAIFREYGLQTSWVQENQSRSEKKGVIRGLHFQFPPYAETKLVRAVKGLVLDVFVDLRRNSSTFGEWDSVELSEENKKVVFIPRGFAHGFCALTEVSEVVYRVDSYYNPESEGGIIWNDKTLMIKWPVHKPILSKKDSALKTFNDFVRDYNGTEL